MERAIKYEPRYPWMDMAVGDHFVPSKDLAKVTMTTLAAKANAKFKPMRFSAKTTKGRWEIRRVA